MNLAKKLMSLFERDIKVGDYVLVASHEGPDGAPSPHSNKKGEVVAIEGEKSRIKMGNGEEILVKTSVLSPMGEAKEKTLMICRECGHKFKKAISSGSVEVKCPKCGGYDTDVE